MTRHCSMQQKVCLGREGEGARGELLDYVDESLQIPRTTGDFPTRDWNVG